METPSGVIALSPSLIWIWAVEAGVLLKTSQIRAALLLASLVAVLWISGCAAPREPAKPFVPPVFPPPPEEPRFIFEMTLVSTAQVKPEDKQDHLRALLTGQVARGKALAKPFDVEACQGRVYVSDTVSRYVMAYDFVNQRAFEIGLEEPGSLQKPLGLDTDADCNLYVADSGSKRIQVYNQDGKFLNAIGGPTWFHRLSHVAANPEGTKIFSVDTGGVGTQEHRVRVFDAQTGDHLYDIGTRGVEPGQFNLPRDIALGAGGLLYVVDGGNFRVQVFEQDGTFVRTFGNVGRQFGQFSRPKGISVDANDNIYVSDASFGNFQIFTPGGELLLFIGARSGRPGPARYILPAGIDVDEDGRIYFVDQFYAKVDIFRPANLPPEGGYLGAALYGHLPAGAKPAVKAAGTQTKQ